MKIKKAIHHIKHTRPQWYKDYHKWEYHSIVHWVSFTISSLIIILGFVNIIVYLTNNASINKANAASTTLSQDIAAGTMTIANDGSHALTGGNVSLNSQNTTGSLGVITVVDNRGTGVGWNATTTSSHFYKYNSPVMTGGANNTVTVGAGSTAYTGTLGTYTITITSGGAVGVAAYSVTGPGSDNNSGTTGTNVSIGSKGLKATFASATYTTSDAWTIRVDIIPVSGFRVTPGSLTTISGSASNVTAGSQHTFTDTADATALITASTGFGMGSYSVTPDLQLTIPANSYANTYTATVIETIL